MGGTECVCRSGVCSQGRGQGWERGGREMIAAEVDVIVLTCSEAFSSTVNRWERGVIENWTGRERENSNAARRHE